VNSITAAFLEFDHHRDRLAGDEFERLHRAVQGLRHRRLAPAVSEERKHLDGGVADEFDIVVNGIEYEIKLPLLHGRIKRR